MPQITQSPFTIAKQVIHAKRKELQNASLSPEERDSFTISNVSEKEAKAVSALLACTAFLGNIQKACEQTESLDDLVNQFTTSTKEQTTQQFQYSESTRSGKVTLFHIDNLARFEKNLETVQRYLTQDAQHVTIKNEPDGYYMIVIPPLPVLDNSLRPGFAEVLCKAAYYIGETLGYQKAGEVGGHNFEVPGRGTHSIVLIKEEAFIAMNNELGRQI